MNWKKDCIAAVICFLISFVYTYPQIVFHQPNLLDVAETWGFGTNAISNIVLEFTSVERFRPIYALQRSVMNSIFAYHAPYYFFSYAALLSLTLLLIYRLIYRPNISQIINGYICVLLLISPCAIDAYWRLGTAENMFTVILLISLLFLKYKKYGLLLISLVALMGAKETAVFYIPLFMIFYVAHRRFKALFVLMVGYTLYVYKLYGLVRYSQIHTEVYTSLFSFSLSSIADMARYLFITYSLYYEILIVAACLCILRIMRGSKRDTHVSYVWELFLAGLSLVGGISILFFQNKYQPYYVFPFMVSSVIYFGWELTHADKILRYVVMIYIGLCFVMFRVPQYTLERIYYWQRDYAGDNALIEKIKNTDDGKYTFINPYRPELQPALRVLYNRIGLPINNNVRYGIVSVTSLRLPNHAVCGHGVIGGRSCKWSIKTL